MTMLTKEQIKTLRSAHWGICRQAILAIELQRRIDNAIEVLSHPVSVEERLKQISRASKALDILKGKTSTQQMLDEVIDHIMEV